MPPTTTSVDEYVSALDVNTAERDPLLSRNPAAIVPALDGFVASAEPAVTFTSLASVCVPAFADACSIVIVEQNEAGYQIRSPRQDAGADGRGALVVSVCEPYRPADSAAEEPDGYSATVAFSWADPARPARSDAVIAQLLADRAAHLTRGERLAAAAERHAARAENLQIALASNREIGQALGILMITHKITSQHAFHLISEVSQNSNRKLREVAADICDTGTLDTGTLDTAHLLAHPTNRPPRAPDDHVLSPPLRRPAPPGGRRLPCPPVAPGLVGRAGQ